MKECYNCFNAIDGCEIKDCELYSKWTPIPNKIEYKIQFEKYTHIDKNTETTNITKK